MSSMKLLPIVAMFLICTGCAYGTTPLASSSGLPFQTQIPDGTRTAAPTEEQTATPSPASPSPSPTPVPTPDPIKQQLAAMSTDEKIGQMVLVGFKGYAPDEPLEKLIKNDYITGIIAYGANVKDAKQLVDLTNSIKKANTGNKNPLFISVDEEGGRITRLPDGIHKLPSGMEIGKKDSPRFCREIGGALAEMTSAFGFNLDFAPVMDVLSNPKNTVIGDRSLGSSGERVAALGAAELEGIQGGGVIPVVKHFPGHGDTAVDSHIGLPTSDKTLEELNALELIPFREAVKAGADAVMVAHILLHAIDPKNPATMSKPVVDILRKDMGFSGVVFTDDLTMGAITKNYAIGDAAVAAVSAGCDVVLVCHGYDNAEAVLNALRTAAANGTISESRLDESVYRILTLKRKYALSDEPVGYVDSGALNQRIDKVLANG